MKASGLSLAIAVLAFGASTIYLAVQLSEERAHSEQLADATRALNARIAELEKTRDEGRIAINGTFGSINLPPGAMQNAQLPPPPAATEWQPDAQAAVGVNGPFVPPQSEAFQKMMRAQMRSHNKQMYADVGAQLGLTREEVNKLIDLLTDQQTSGLAIPGGVTDPAEIQRLMEEALRENKAKIASLLGPDKLESFEEYQRSLPARQELDMLARQIEGSDAAPLNEDQRKRLLAALIEERKRIPSPQFPTGTDDGDFAKTYSEWQADYNARVAAQARGILNAEQYTAYDDYLKWQKEMNAQMYIQRVQGGGAGDVMFSVAAPGVMVGESSVVTATTTDVKPGK
jgi:outer membrane murein-binding lipoprotein Lpp